MKCVRALRAELINAAFAFVLAPAAFELFTQAKPNFAGTWTLQTPATPPTNLGGATGGGSEMVITQDATGIKIRRSYARAPATFVIKFDGSETTQAVPPLIRPGMTSELVSRASWSADRLTITTTRVVTDQSTTAITRFETKEVLFVRERELVVERTVPSRGVEKTIETYIRKEPPSAP
jgi:hypothetical protein